jgi:hypothetical protein
MAAGGVESETPHGAGQGVEEAAHIGARRRQRRGPRGAAPARAQAPHQASEGVLGEAVVEFDDATGNVQNVARLGTRPLVERSQRSHTPSTPPTDVSKPRVCSLAAGPHSRLSSDNHSQKSASFPGDMGFPSPRSQDEPSQDERERHFSRTRV